MTEDRKPRRKAGEGSVRSYTTAHGTRWLIVYGIKEAGTGKRRQKLERGFPNERAALKALRERSVETSKPGYVEPSKQTFGDYLDEWLAGQATQIRPSTLASYTKNIRLHVKPHLGAIPLRALTTPQLNALYARLLADGRQDHEAGKGLSARTVRYVHTIVGKALREGVEARLLPVSPATSAKPPSARAAIAPEMKVWDEDQLSTFLAQPDEMRVAWLLLAMTGMRRGEALALRWEDVDLDAARLQVRRSVGLIREHGVGYRLEVGPTKTGKARVVDLDPATVTELRAHRRARRELSLSLGIGDRLGEDSALILGDVNGDLRHPEHFSREWQRRMARTTLPKIRLHDLRHTHATILLKAGVPPKVVAERLGIGIMVLLQTYAHVIPGMQQDAAKAFGTRILGGGA